MNKWIKGILVVVLITICSLLVVGCGDTKEWTSVKQVDDHTICLKIKWDSHGQYYGYYQQHMFDGIKYILMREFGLDSIIEKSSIGDGRDLVAIIKIRDAINEIKYIKEYGEEGSLLINGVMYDVALGVKIGHNCDKHQHNNCDCPCNCQD